MYSSVLLAIDRDDEAGAVVLAKKGADLAQATGCRLHLIYVRPELPRSFIEPMPANWEAANCSRSEAWLREFAAGHGLGQALDAAHSPSGSIAREVVRLAREIDVDCICVAAHTMDLGRWILGTNALVIARDAPCDVLVAREKGAPESLGEDM